MTEETKKTIKTRALHMAVSGADLHVPTLYWDLYQSTKKDCETSVERHRLCMDMVTYASDSLNEAIRETYVGLA